MATLTLQMMEVSSERPSKAPTFTPLKRTSFYPEGQLILGCTETTERNEVSYPAELFC